jgi:drug/metabolite transporter (DMT)-like permease
MMRLQTSQHTIAVGVGLMLIGTLCGSGADAALKAVASDYAAPQVLLIAALLSIVLTFVANRGSDVRQVLRTGAPFAMAGRSVATVIAAIGFYQAFVRLPFSEVFLFIGVMPLMAAALSGPVLGERVTIRVWAILGVGFLGLMFLFPSAESPLTLNGHLFAALGSFAGTLSVVLSRYICRHETHSLAQVLFPQIALAVVMAALLPMVARPMTLTDVGIILLYAVLVFAARWIMVVVSRLLPAWLSLQLLNLQFVWMVALGFFVFDETTDRHVFIGAGLIIVAGVILARDEMLRTRAAHAMSAAAGKGGQILDAATIARSAARAGR